MNLKLLISVCMLSLGQWCDVATTSYGISIFGVGIEANSLISNIYIFHGVVGILFVKVISLIIVLLLVYYGFAHGYSKYMLSICVVVGVILVIVSINNMYVMASRGLF